MLACRNTPEHVNIVFLFNDTATTEIYTLSLHDALPISRAAALSNNLLRSAMPARLFRKASRERAARESGYSSKPPNSTRLKSRHTRIFFAFFSFRHLWTSLVIPM